MSEDDKTSCENISIEDISNRLLKIELMLSNHEKNTSILHLMGSFLKRIFTKENIEFVFSFLAFLISVSVAIMLLSGQ